jgi:hypothetical protein
VYDSYATDRLAGRPIDTDVRPPYSLTRTASPVMRVTTWLLVGGSA